MRSDGSGAFSASASRWMAIAKQLLNRFFFPPLLMVANDVI